MRNEGKRRFRARGRVSSPLEHVRDWLSDLIAPLSTRERIVYSSLILIGLFLLFAAPSRATFEDEGKLYQIAPRQCTAGDAWTNPGLAAGQPSIEASDERTNIDASNAAVWQNRAGAIICGNFELQPEHAITQPAVELSLRTSDLANIATKLIETTLDGGLTDFAPVEANERVNPITPNAAIEQSVAVLDSFVNLSYSTDGGKTWRLLHTFDGNLLRYGESRIAVALPADVAITGEGFSIKADVVSSLSDASILLDAVTLSYVVGRPDELALDFGNRAADSLPAVARGDLAFELTAKDPVDGIWQGLSSQISNSRGPDVNATIEIRDQDNELIAAQTLRLDWLDSDLANQHRWKASIDDAPLQIEPGRYHMLLSYTSADGRTQTIEQDFLWGVLALNTDKSEYTVNESAQIMMSVLDELGRTVCDAELQLSIEGPSSTQLYSTSGRELVPSDTCDIYGDHIQADYELMHTFSAIGNHRLSLSAVTENGEFTANQEIEVYEQLPIRLKRSGPTRVYPIVDYPMSFTLSSEDGFSGQLREYVPASFKIKDATTASPHDSVEQISEAVQLITWQVEIDPGEEISLGYEFDAPDVSPEFYLLGEAELIDEQQRTIYQEARQWQLAGDAVGRMLLLYAGASDPAGWSCVSCTSGDPFFETFIRGNSTYGGTGGGLNHTHTATGSVAESSAVTLESAGGSGVSDATHTHTFAPTISTESNLPSYRQLRVIRADTAGEPATLPTGAIAVFDGAIPSGWTAYTASNGTFIRGESTVGVTGGSDTHTHTITGTTSAAAGGTYGGRNGGTQSVGAADTHDHSVSGSTVAQNNLPPYREVILASLDSSAAPPNDMIAMWDEDAPLGWASVSGSGEDLHQRFIRPSASYGANGGASSHAPSATVVTSAGPSLTAAGRVGSLASSDTHTHEVTSDNFSNQSHLPPYRDVLFAKRDASASFEQASYRWYENSNATDVGAPLAAENTAGNAPARGIGFRLRMSLHVELEQLAQSGKTFKLQYAQRSGTCDINFSGESFIDVATASGGIRYIDNSSPGDGQALTANANDPTHGGDSVNTQTYEESNNFTNSQSAIPIGEDGLWDFALVDVAASELTSYCFRVVESDGTLLDVYTVVPEITTAELPPRMILLFDGATIPNGWSCISCAPGDLFYQRFARGEATATGSGGSATHSHSASGSVAADAGATTGRSDAGAAIAAGGHAHTYSPVIEDGNSLPVFRQLRYIRYENGTPATIPSGAIALFDAAVPAGWTRYSAQDGNFVRGEDTVGATGGNNGHSHTISGSLSASTGTTYAPTAGGSQSDVATAGHTHAVSGTSSTVDIQPPFIETILGQADSDTNVAGSMIVMWDKTPGGSWNCVSCTGGDPLYQRFFKPAATYGTTGGSATHTHIDSVFNSAAADQTTTTRAQQNNASLSTHVHEITVSSYSTDSNLPPYNDVIFAQASSTNNPPITPTNLVQQQTDTSVLGVGDYTNETTVVFRADISDNDNPDTLQLCIEVEPLGTAFDNIDTSCGASASYTGTPVNASVTIAGLSDATDYHWQARTKDSIGAASGWISYGANAESAADFRIDSTGPTGTVYDGSTIGVDVEYNNGALDTLSANWNIDSSTSGLSGYEYSIGTSPGATDVLGWTAHGTNTSFTETGLSLNTSQPYYINVRTSDNAGSQSVISSDGQFVSPSLSFSSSTSQVAFGLLNSANGYTSTTSSDLTTSTNAYNGYIIRGYATGLLTSGANTIPMFDGGTYAAPDEWLGNNLGYGYYTSDTDVQGSNIFNNNPCPGGGTPPCYAPFSLTAPGDIIADNTSTVSGTPIINETFTVNHRVTTDALQQAGTYRTTIIYSVTARY